MSVAKGEPTLARASTSWSCPTAVQTADGTEAGPDTVLASPYVLVGTIDEIADTLVERRERWQLSYYVCNDDSVDTLAPVVARLNGK